MNMTDLEFEDMLTEALIRSCRETWIDGLSEEELAREIPDTSNLDARVKKSLENLRVPRAEPMKRPLHKRVLRYAAMFFLSVSILFGALMLNPEARAYIVNLVTTWYEDHNTYSFQDDSDASIPEHWTFAYIPDGFTLSYERESATHCTYKYNQTEEILLDISITNESGATNLDYEHYVVTTDAVRGDAVDVYTATHPDWPNMIVWYREDLGALVSISGNIAMEEIFLVLESMSP